MSRQYAKLLASGQIKEEGLVYLETIASGFSILDSQICAESLSFGKDGCYGDSGGPVMSLNSDFQFVARGIISCGSLECNNEHPGVYTRVSKYLGWIDSVINGH